MEKKGCKSVEKENGDLLTTSRRFRGQQPTEECSTAAKSQILTFRTYKLSQSKTILPVVSLIRKDTLLLFLNSRFDIHSVPKYGIVYVYQIILYMYSRIIHRLWV